MELLRAEGSPTVGHSSEYEPPSQVGSAYYHVVTNPNTQRTNSSALQNDRQSPLTFEKAAELMLAESNGTANCEGGRVQVEFLARPLQLLAHMEQNGSCSPGNFISLKTPTLLKLKSNPNDVLQSFWIPSLVMSWWKNRACSPCKIHSPIKSSSSIITTINSNVNTRRPSAILFKQYALAYHSRLGLVLTFALENSRWRKRIKCRRKKSTLIPSLTQSTTPPACSLETIIPSHIPTRFCEHIV